MQGTGGNPIRALEKRDLASVRQIIDDTRLFPSALLAGMVHGFFSGKARDDIWLTHDDGVPSAILYCAREKLAEGTWNMLLLAVHTSRQGQGVGARMVQFLEAALRGAGARVVIVETSGLPEFERARSFYRRCGYSQEARIRDFYKSGDDKVVFWKSLSSTDRLAR